MTNTTPKELSVEELLSSEKYIIPLYQRNYAWSENEITQLLQDISDVIIADKNSNYYIGTLIVDERNDGKFEVIDGQQRHTTLTLINAVLRDPYTSKQQSNLLFDARSEVQNYISELYFNFEGAKNANTDDEELINIKNAIKYIEGFFYKEKEDFKDYFYKNVKIIRVVVPEGTDINHYFEVMNNRGEQLEKHEILKAKFISKIDESLREKFAIIWDACSQMDRQIQSCFKPENRKEIFGDNYSDIPKEYLKNIESNTNNEAVNTVTSEDDPNKFVNILKNISLNKPQTTAENEPIEATSKYKSIIDFPNFLLQVLKIQYPNVSLDDKKLLDEFGYTNGELPNAIDFINSLLYYRTLFDKYIIKREEANGDWSWDISKPAKSNDSLVYKNTFGVDESEDSIDNKQIIMIQSMLHVSFPANNYKNWLHEVLKYLATEREISKVSLIKKLEEISKTEFDNVRVKYHNGTHTPRFLFNYLDYVLWSKRDDFPDLKVQFNKFKFSQNNSVEHLHPQKEKEKLQISETENLIDNFGNLCLISSSSNSKYNDYNFEAKKYQFNDRKSIESLKQVIMFSKNQWNTTEIQAHQDEMITLLEEHYKS